MKRSLFALAVALAPLVAPAWADAPAPVAPVAPLTRAAVEHEVLAHSPALEASLAALEAARARADAAGRWSDPELMAAVAPGTFGAGDPSPVYRLELRQRITPPGQRGAEQQSARADAEGVAHDADTARLDLLREARVAFAEYRRATTARAVHAEMVDLAAQIRQVALARYAAGTVEQQDPLLAGVEAAKLSHHAVMLESDTKVAAARLNALMGRPTSAPLPPPAADDAASLPSTDAMRLAMAATDRDSLHTLARDGRPEIAASTSRLAGRVAAERAAGRARWPALSLGVMYDRFMVEPSWRTAVEVGVELPVFGRRGDEARAARADVERAAAERAGTLLQVDREVTEAAARYDASAHELEVQEQAVLPAARQAVAASRTAYEAGRGTMSALLDAVRSLNDARLEAIDARARRDDAWADLARALGHDVDPTMGDMR